MLVIVAVVVAVILGSQGKNPAATTAGGVRAAGQGASGHGRRHRASTPAAPASVPTLDLYEDFQCPICAEFEELFGAADRRHGRGQRRSSWSTTRCPSSTTTCATTPPTGRPTRPPAPPTPAGSRSTTRGLRRSARQEGAGYTDAQLRQFAEPAGITGSALTTWQQCYDGQAHNQYVESVQTQREKDGVNGTPTLKLNGKALDLQRLTPGLPRRTGQGRDEVSALTA